MTSVGEAGADREPRRIVPGSVRAAVVTRLGVEPGEQAHVLCHYCGFWGHVTWFFTRRSRYGWPATRNLEWDHVIPLARGGTNDADNIVLACRNCNRSKGSKTVAEWRRRTAN